MSISLRIGLAVTLTWIVAATVAAFAGLFNAYMPIASVITGQTVTEFDRYSMVRYLRAMLAPVLAYWIGHVAVALVLRWRRNA